MYENFLFSPFLIAFVGNSCTEVVLFCFLLHTPRRMGYVLLYLYINVFAPFFLFLHFVPRPFCGHLGT